MYMNKSDLENLTGKEMKEKILKDESMPASFLDADKKREYIVKPRGTIFWKHITSRKSKLFPFFEKIKSALNKK